ncbi:MAG: hypothetical protein IPF68_08530 [Bacteroidales bacterium]|nr:hypothetical protein [Bacteroidales bacterium]
MDLNKIVIYGEIDGTLADQPRENYIGLGDGIIGGQGDGPLRPTPLLLGVLTFTDNSFLHDLAVGELMRFPTEKLALLKAAQDSINGLEYSIFVNGSAAGFSDSENFSSKPYHRLVGLNT